MESPKVYILILNWNGKKDTINCLESVKKIDYPDYNIVIIDNGSSDDSVEEIHKKFKDIKIIKNKENLGYAEGNNVGIRYALNNKADYIWILNNDTIVDKNCLTKLIQTAELNKDIGIVGSKIYDYGTNRIQYLGIKNLFLNLLLFKKIVGGGKEDNGQFDSFTDVDAVAGCSTLIRLEMLKKIGLFDKKLFLYYEEVDLFVRAKKAGYQLKVAPKSHVWHKGSATAKKVSGFVRYYIARNNFIFAKRYFSIIEVSIFTIKYILIQILMMLLVLFIQNKNLNVLKDYIRGVFAGINYLFTDKIVRY